MITRLPRAGSDLPDSRMVSRTPPTRARHSSQSSGRTVPGKERPNIRRTVVENTTELSVTALRIYTDHLPQEGQEQLEVLRGGEAELPVIAPGRYARRPPGA